MSANVALLKTLLTREGYTVVTASDGQQALNTVDSAESVILSLALVIEARDAYTAVTASGSPGTPRLWVPR